MNRHCIPGLTMSTALTGNFSAGVSGRQVKRCTQGFSAYTYCIMPTPRCWHRETGRYDLAWKIYADIPDNINTMVMIIKGIVISFMFMNIYSPSENSCFSKIFPVLLKCDFSWFQPIIGRFYKMRVSWEFNIYNFLSPFINTVLSFSNTMWILSVAR